MNMPITNCMGCGKLYEEGGDYANAPDRLCVECHLREQLRALQQAYGVAAEPIVRRLVAIASTRVRPQVIELTPAQQTAGLGAAREGRMFGTTWRVVADRFANESRAKSEDGSVYSVQNTAREIASRYAAHPDPKPVVVVTTIGLGRALADILSDLGVPVLCETRVMLKRMGDADVYVSPSHE